MCRGPRPRVASERSLSPELCFSSPRSMPSFPEDVTNPLQRERSPHSGVDAPALGVSVSVAKGRRPPGSPHPPSWFSGNHSEPVLSEELICRVTDSLNCFFALIHFSRAVFRVLLSGYAECPFLSASPPWSPGGGGTWGAGWGAEGSGEDTLCA